MTKYEKEYHEKQVEKPYRSTEVFINWLENMHFLNHDGEFNICDMACGGGANAIYLANHFKNIMFTGIDINEELINCGNEMVDKHSMHKNCKLYKDDWYHLDSRWRGKFDGIISFQTLSWLPEYKEPLEQLARLNANWIALSSLFYEGNIEYTIKCRDYYRDSNNKEYTDCYYNIYSIIQIRHYFEELGYREFAYVPYNIDIDLPKTDSMDLGTYTVRTEEGDRIQISGGMMLPWYFIVAYK